MNRVKGNLIATLLMATSGCVSGIPGKDFHRGPLPGINKVNVSDPFGPTPVENGRQSNGQQVLADRSERHTVSDRSQTRLHREGSVATGGPSDRVPDAGLIHGEWIQPDELQSGMLIDPGDVSSENVVAKSNLESSSSELASDRQQTSIAEKLSKNESELPGTSPKHRAADETFSEVISSPSDFGTTTPQQSSNRIVVQALPTIDLAGLPIHDLESEPEPVIEMKTTEFPPEESTVDSDSLADPTNTDADNTDSINTAPANTGVENTDSINAAPVNSVSLTSDTLQNVFGLDVLFEHGSAGLITYQNYNPVGSPIHSTGNANGESTNRGTTDTGNGPKVRSTNLHPLDSLKSILQNPSSRAE